MTTGNIALPMEGIALQTCQEIRAGKWNKDDALELMYGLEADIELPADYDSRRGAAILACRPARVNRLGSRGFVQIGEVR